MIFVTGDTHGDFHRFSTKNFPEQKEMTKNDYVIICGDFGGVWEQKETKREKYWLDWLDKKNFTTLFVDGNHENFDRLNNYPVEEWNGGKIHKIRPSIFHLQRGEVFKINGKTIFAYGGGRSHDIQDGILEKDDVRIKTWMKNPDKMFRINRVSWWSEEIPTVDDIYNALINLEKHNYNIDIIISHTPPANTLYRLGFELDVIASFLEDKQQKTGATIYSGHIHIDGINYANNNILIYKRIIQIA